jgi:hypothetical protein
MFAVPPNLDVTCVQFKSPTITDTSPASSGESPKFFP